MDKQVFSSVSVRPYAHQVIMGTAKISTLPSTPLGILLVFYTDGGCWQFRVLSSEGAVFGEQKLYYTADAAEKAGRDWVRLNN